MRLLFNPLQTSSVYHEHPMYSISPYIVCAQLMVLEPLLVWFLRLNWECKNGLCIAFLAVLHSQIPTNYVTMYAHLVVTCISESIQNNWRVLGEHFICVCMEAIGAIYLQGGPLVAN